MTSSIIDEYLEYQKLLEDKYGKRSVILMMVGLFYEMYGINVPSDSVQKIEIVSKILNIQLAKKKDKKLEYSKQNHYMCGFPCYSVGKHLSKLITNNFTVAIYDQFDIKNSKKKGRKLVNIYSPSTYIDEEIMEENSLMSVYTEKYYDPIQKRNLCYGSVATINLSTGKNKLYEFYDTKQNPDYAKKEIIKLLSIVNPCEVIISSSEDNNFLDESEYNNILFHTLKVNEDYKNPIYQETFLEKVFGKKSLTSVFEYLELEGHQDLFYCYIQLLQFAYEHDPNIIKKIHKPEFSKNSESLDIENDALFQLNLLQSNQQQLYNIKPKFSCLLDVIDTTCTKMGRRLLKERMLNPITNPKELEKRYEDIERVKNNYKEYRNHLKYISDFEKKYRKLVLKKLHPYELANLDLSFKNIIQVLNLAKNDFKISKSIIQEFKKFYQNYTLSFDLKILEQYNLTNIKDSFFNKGFDKDIDKLFIQINNLKILFRSLAKGLSNILDKDKDDLVKVGRTEKDGYFLSTTKKRWLDIQNNVNEDIFILNFEDKNLFIDISDFRCKSLSNNTQLYCPLIEENSYKIVKLIDNIKILVKKRYLQKLVEYEQKFGDIFNKVINIIAEIDITTNAANIAIKYAYSKPKIEEKNISFLKVKEIRHPIIERVQDDIEYVPNDIEFCQSGILLYGLNSSGKSSLLRALGCNIILAQMGMYVSAKEFIFSPFKKLLTKISTIDNLFKGQSTFIFEMQELKNILNKADENSLVLCDELTAGTETDSATGIVSSTLIYLLNKSTNFIFTTHLHGIIKFKEIKKQEKLSIFHFNIIIDNEKIIYERKLKKGSGKNLYGIEIAKVMGLDSEFIKNAFKFRNQFRGKSEKLLSSKRSRYNTKVIVDCCEICGKTDRLQTHHINEQRLSDENGNIKHFHKNIRHNLKILCEGCHQKEHN